MNKTSKIVVSGALLLGVVLYYMRGDDVVNGYITEKLSKGDITEKITATGIINPISTINIGTQVSGTIAEIYVDYNSQVGKGQVLAQIDPALFEATVAARQAALNVAKAQVDVVENDIIYYEKKLGRIKKLNKAKYSADADLETAERDYNNAVVQKELRKAEVKQAEAALLSAEIDLKYAKIVSPVEGIVVSKEVEVGQTVAASFQTPTLFNVAEDLTKMQIETSVVEADIAKVTPGQKVEFNVDSYPDEKFFGVVTQVRNEAITTSNVVTYEVIIEIDNKDLQLKPGMTANVEIISAEKQNVWLVPNKALRFYMDDESGKPKRYKDKGLWVMQNENPVRMAIKTGVSDEENTEVMADELKDGMLVVMEKQDEASIAKNNIKMRMPH